MRPVLLCLMLAGGSLAACQPVAGDRILAEDMARAVPVFAGLPPELALGYAPAPGSRRDYSGPELARLGRRYGLEAPAGIQACFVRTVETLSRERIAAALGTVLPAARIEVLEFSREAVPNGELRFFLSGLQAGSGATRLWRGEVAPWGQPARPVWALVHIAMDGVRVVAAVTIRPGSPILAVQLREEPSTSLASFERAAQIVGRVARRAIAEGAEIQPQWLTPAADVLRGQRVTLEVRSGLARLLLEGEAQEPGRKGDLVAVRIAPGGKVLRGVVDGRGRVLVAALLGGPR